MSLPITAAAVSQYVTSLFKRVGRVPILVVFLWLLTLWWGERAVFQKSVVACEWHLWESWPAHANPHHILFVADPQLVDPHTYPGRPWPLSTLTVLYTDLYLRRIYGYLLQKTQPHTTIFLGDLFDGGREWAAVDYESPEDRYKKYDTNFWLQEYNRFMTMFIGGWYENKWNNHLSGEGRRIVASLPGNHDLGFAGGINEHVRNRFEAHFGPSNRIDILGNHTFVSLDTVSLSAMDQVDPATGSSGAGDGTGHYTKHMEIWKPVEGFLRDVKSRRAKAVQRRYQYLKSLSDPTVRAEDHALRTSKASSVNKQSSSSGSSHRKDTTVPSANFPTVLLTHVPLFRNADVTCGPHRERGNAIPLSAGYQYQNVLTAAISKDIVDHLGAEQLSMIYSGDDHDYCEIEHGEFTGQIKEITVKSMSWAMGVRKPGVQLASLWNPIDMEAIDQGKAPSSTPRDTVQNHLCILPDQLAIFIRYGQILALTIVILIVRAILYNSRQAYQQLSSSPIDLDKSQSLLPLTRKTTPPSSPQFNSTQPQNKITSNTSTPSYSARARSRSSGKLSGYGNFSSPSRSTSPVTTNASGDTDDWGMPKTPIAATAIPTLTSKFFPNITQNSSLSSRLQIDHHTSPYLHASVSTVEKLAHCLVTPSATKPGEFLRSMNIVAGPVLLFYFWLLWNG